MKLVQNLVKVFLIVLVSVISINFTGCKKTQELVSEEPQTKLEQVDQFLNELKKLREDSEKSKEYFEIMDKLSVLVKEEIKRYPEMRKSFLEDMVEIAVKAGPGLALEVEDYADTELKQEVEKLRKQNDKQIKQIKRLEEENDEFSSQTVEFRGELTQYKQEKTKLFEEMFNYCEQGVKEIKSFDELEIWKRWVEELVKLREKYLQ